MNIQLGEELLFASDQIVNVVWMASTIAGLLRLSYLGFVEPTVGGPIKNMITFGFLGHFLRVSPSLCFTV